MENVYRIAHELLSNGVSFAYATIISQDGATPRGAGSKMLVLPDRIEATIGGGLMEARVIDTARSQVLANRRSYTMSFDLSGAAAAEAEFICGGCCQLLIVYVDAANAAHGEVFAQAAQLAESGGLGWLITVLNRDDDTTSLCLSIGGSKVIGEYQPSFMLQQEMLLQPSHIAIHGGVDDRIQYIVDPVHTGGVVYLFGAGHVSMQVARITTMLEFNTVVIDDRAEFLTPQRFPACNLMLVDSLNHLPVLPVDGNSYLLIITRGHTNDEAVLRWAMEQQAGYVGMIGSTNKRDRIYSNMVRDGYTMEQLAAVNSPIGIDIGGQTPAEIAVSIAAELVQCRAANHSF